jgi:hypothetical protein
LIIRAKTAKSHRLNPQVVSNPVRYKNIFKRIIIIIVRFYKAEKYDLFQMYLLSMINK